jgi:hypothetical protein
VPADDQLQRDHSMGFGKGSIEIAVGFGDHSGFGIASWREFARRRGRIEARRQRLDLRCDEVGDIFSHVGVGGAYCHQRPKTRQWCSSAAEDQTMVLIGGGSREISAKTRRRVNRGEINQIGRDTACSNIWSSRRR